jgi:hypothetical protein
MNHSYTKSLQISTSNSNHRINNPWDDKQNFIQDVGDLEGFLNFLDMKGICKSDDDHDEDNASKRFIESESRELEMSVIKNENPQDILILNYNLDILRELNSISKINYDKLKSLEVLYENYRGQSILSKIKNDELCYSLASLIEVFDKIENSRIKLANLIHNTNLSDNNVIKIKHEKKFEFIKIIKSILTQLDNQNINQRNDIELIKLSSNVHPETINKIVT